MDVFQQSAARAGSLPTVRVVKKRPNGANICRTAREVRQALRRADEQAAAIVEAAQTRAEHLCNAAEQTGFQQGAVKALAQLLGAARLKKAIVAASKAAVVELVLEICAQVLGEAIADPQSLNCRIERALDYFGFTHDLTLVCAEGQSSVVEQYFSGLTVSINIALREDPALPIGAVRLENEFGSIDISPELHLSAIASALRQACAAQDSFSYVAAAGVFEEQS